MFFRVFGQLTGLEKRLVAFIALEGFFLAVSEGEMFIVVGFFVKYFITLFTFDLELASVDYFEVSFEVVFTGEGHVAAWFEAFVGLGVVGVGYHVSFEVGVSFEGFLAVGTDMFFEIFVGFSSVSVEL